MSTSVIELDRRIRFEEFWAGESQLDKAKVADVDKALAKELVSGSKSIAHNLVNSLYALASVEDSKNVNMVVVASAHLLNNLPPGDVAKTLQAISGAKLVPKEKARVLLLLISLLANAEARGDTIQLLLDLGQDAFTTQSLSRMSQLITKLDVANTRKVSLLTRLREMLKGQTRIQATLSLLACVTKAEEVQDQYFLDLLNSPNLNHLFSINKARVAMLFLKARNLSLFTLIDECLSGKVNVPDPARLQPFSINLQEFQRKARICSFLRLAEQRRRLPLKQLQKLLGVDRRCGQKVAFQAFKLKLISFKIDEQTDVLEVTRIGRKYFDEEALTLLQRRLGQAAEGLARGEVQ